MTKNKRPTPKGKINKFIHCEQSKKNVDRMVYVVGIGGNIAVIPQIIKAWQSDAPGLAVLTWLMFMAFGFIWLIYAIQNNLRPLIVAQIVGISCNFLVVLGWATHNL